MLRKVLQALQDAPVSTQPWDLGGPRSYTLRELSGLVYGTTEPTLAQASALRRAVAVLVRRGQAESVRHKITWVRRALSEQERQERHALIQANRAKAGLPPE